MEHDHRHVAYLQIWAKADIEAHTIVVTDEDSTEESAQAREDKVAIVAPFSDTYNPATQFPVGVSDRSIRAGTRGTIVLSGIVAVKMAVPQCTERSPGGYFLLSDTFIGQGMPDLPVQPIGTLVQPNLPGGEYHNSQYYPMVSLFLCPWLCAARLPVQAEERIDLRRIFTETGFSAFETTLADKLQPLIIGQTDENKQKMLAIIVDAVQAGLHKGSINDGIKFLLP